MKNKKLLMLSMVLLSLLLVACGPTSSGESKFPTGKFIKVGEPNRSLVFNEDRTFIVLEGNSTLVSGIYSVDSDTYTDESNSQNCPSMSFKYTFDGANLTFNYLGKPADDPCLGRLSDFNNVTYTLSK